jgi:ELWxxDGT repeat protein
MYFASEDDSAEMPITLWETDGTPEGTTNIGAFLSAWPSGAGTNGQMFFNADDGVHGDELWKSDGTVTGTVIIKDIRPSSEGAHVSGLTNIGDLWFFSANDGKHGSELWQTDGTTEGTILVTDIHPGPQGSYVSYPVEVNGKLYFTADGGEKGGGLWVLKPDSVETPIPGDSNHDGIFNSSDFVEVFKAGKYEDGIPGNATFEEGDWDGNGDFDSGDFVYVFQKGNYVAAAKPKGADIDSVLAAILSRDLTGNSDRLVLNTAAPKSQRPIGAARHMDVLPVDLVFAALAPQPSGIKTLDLYDASMLDPAWNESEELII